MLSNGGYNLLTGFSPYLQANKELQDQRARLINSQSNDILLKLFNNNNILGKLEVPKQVKPSAVSSPVLKVEGQGQKETYTVYLTIKNRRLYGISSHWEEGIMITL